MQPLKQLIANKDYDGLRKLLSQYPSLANEDMALDDRNTSKAHPLQRICDAVFTGLLTDEEAVKMAKLFLEAGANVNGNSLIEKHDTPLIAAASLHADMVTLLYIAKGATLNHAGCHGGTALHWAAWCGREKVVAALVGAGADINKKCIDFEATPLFWTIHGFKSGNGTALPAYLRVVTILLQAGADKNIPNGEGKTVFDLLTEKDTALQDALA